jgi:hypothetical protein
MENVKSHDGLGVIQNESSIWQRMGAGGPVLHFYNTTASHTPHSFWVLEVKHITEVRLQ